VSVGKNVLTAPKITLIGGPTALIEAGGLRLITDPTFDAPGEYVLPHATLKKTAGPALTAEEVLPLDAVLLSHDQHSDNLDNSGRTLLGKAARTFTTSAGAKRLGGSGEGLAPWESAPSLSRTGARCESRRLRRAMGQPASNPYPAT
jgi:L-ascorbate metabolism protein UlaG (beta-lactamase superfamily)